ncbi:HTTM domain-containing protein [Streptomyces meridianus]|uniref:HTTM domain-containing protein n=1 Tax=Streptomyces meridianus TaxID=2938945 RepID=A0ABT0X7A1_9ACTN|nr:HTTM domain-containing protein [Streptomyces meridianus]MCM2578411.1 HTTM domain-containing protein [Streptomyces meridianus]
MRFENALARGLNRITRTALGPYQAAVVRIGFSFTWFVFLLREWPHRAELYGPDGPWSWDMARRLIADNDAFTVLMWSDSGFWFELVYLLALTSAALLLLGWRTRTMSVLFMLGVLAMQNRSVFMGDGGDNVIRLMALYLMFLRCGTVWSLDARRRARRAAATGAPADASGKPSEAPDAPEEPADAPTAGAAVATKLRSTRSGRDATGVVLWSLLGAGLVTATLLGLLSGGWALLFWGLWTGHALWWLACRHAVGSEIPAVMRIVGNLVHNGAFLVIVTEVCLIYATAGWYKIQGSRWQDGTALYYPMHLDYFSPWPALSEALAASGVMVMLITYGTVIVQVAFPFTLFNRRVKNVLLALMITEHAGIAVLLGLPFFSLAMIAADAVFLPTSFLRRLGHRAAGLRARLVHRRKPGVSEAGPAERERTLVG